MDSPAQSYLREWTGSGLGVFVVLLPARHVLSLVIK